MDFFIGVEGTYAPQLDRDTLEVTLHHEQFEADLDLIKSLGVKEFRYPFPWHRIEKVRGAYDWSFLDVFVKAADDRGLEILADTLHHTSFPQWLSEGFLNPEFQVAYPAFVANVADRYPQIQRYAPNNEPTCTLDFCSRRGWWYPYRSSLKSYVDMLKIVAKGTSLAIKALSMRGKQIVHIDTAQRHHPLDSASRECCMFLNDLRFVFDELLLGRKLSKTMSGFLICNGFSEKDLSWYRDNPATIHVRGLNYYPLCEEDRFHSDRAKAPSAAPMGFCEIAHEYIDRLGLPVMLSETNIQGSIRDRIMWLKYMVEECEDLETRVGPSMMRGFTWFPAWDCMGWGMDCLLQEDDHRKWTLDPQGIFWCDEDWNRRHSELSEIYRRLVAGENSATIPRYSLGPQVKDLLGPLLLTRSIEC